MFLNWKNKPYIKNSKEFANNNLLKKLNKYSQDSNINLLIKSENNNESLEQVFSAESTKRISEILDSVASDNGSGYRAVIDGYSIAGKTGTAEMVIDGQYSKDGAKRTYFVGYSPAEKPKYIMAVRLDHPKKCFVYRRPELKRRCEGSNSASIAFKKAMQRILINDSEINSQVES